MLVKEKNYTSTSQNGLHHSNLFINKLNQTIRYTQIMCPSKYKGAVEKYVTPTRTVTRKAARQNHNDDGSDDSNDSTPPRKCGKKEDVDTEGTTISSSGQRPTKMTKAPYNRSNRITCTLFLQNWEAHASRSPKIKAWGQSGIVFYKEPAAKSIYRCRGNLWPWPMFLWRKSKQQTGQLRKQEQRAHRESV